MNGELKAEFFKAEFFSGESFSGYTSGETWNGWACPYFTKEESEKIVLAQNVLADNSAHYDETMDSFIFEIGGETEQYSAVEINPGHKLYPIGLGVWIWEKA